MPEPIVALQAITKIFPGGIIANREANLEVLPGEIHALVGENGAGKSTLMNILYGLLQPDAGEIRIRSRKEVIPSPRHAKRLGIGMVHQHFMLVPSFTVLQNIILGYEPQRAGFFVDVPSARSKVEEYSARYHLNLPFDARLGDLPVGMQQRAEILKAIYRGAEILILDEPTAILTPQETQDLFLICREMAAQQKTILFISHKLKEVLSLSDRVTVMRSGQTLETILSQETDEKQLARWIVGRERIWSMPERHPPTEPRQALKVENLAVRSLRGTLAVNGLSFSVCSGEILGIAGVEGNGQSELAAALTGILPVEQGSIRLYEADITTARISERRALGLRHLPEDRIKVGASLKATISENLIVDPNDRRRFLNFAGRLNWAAIREYARSKIRQYSVLAPGPEAKTGELSGGNLQKVVAARELDERQRALVVLHPTRGLDIGASDFIYRQLNEARDKGSAILLISADLDEIFLLSDRILVIYEGQAVALFRPDEATPETVGLCMTGARRLSQEGGHEQLSILS
jgi:simple sugar transport system ATP-binding protein